MLKGTRSARLSAAPRGAAENDAGVSGLPGWAAHRCERDPDQALNVRTGLKPVAKIVIDARCRVRIQRIPVQLIGRPPPHRSTPRHLFHKRYIPTRERSITRWEGVIQPLRDSGSTAR